MCQGRCGSWTFVILLKLVEYFMPAIHAIKSRRAMNMPRASFHASTPIPDKTPRCCDVKGNNAYIFPGVGLAAVACGATRITDLDMYIAAKALAEAVPTVSASRAETIRPHER